jgi:16S rRNA pseudouridine516 synthase
MTKPAALRLDRLLANLGYGTRSQAQLLLRARRVVLDGRVLDDPASRIALTPDLPDRMTVNGERLDPPPGLVLMLHKPCGVTCSHKEAGPLVYDLLPSRFRLREPALSTIGRLDKDTSGLLLLTDDGALLHKIISPKSHVPKRYLATLDRPLRGDEAAIFASGTLMLEGEEKPLLPATLEAPSPTSAYVTVTEGRYHQVRRMFAAVGNHVVALHRDRIGGLALPDDLAAGAFVGLGVAEAATVVFAATTRDAQL